MDLKEIRNELRKLSETVGGWPDLSGAPALERDWALEKLRTIYEVLRFGGEQTDAPAGVSQAAVQQPSAAPVVLERPQPVAVAPVMADAVSGAVDLNEVLSLERDGEPAEAGPVVPGEAEAAVPGEVGSPGEIPAASALEPETEFDPALEIIDLAAAVDEDEEPAAVPGPDIAPEEEPQPAFKSQPVEPQPEKSQPIGRQSVEPHPAVKQSEPMPVPQFEPEASESVVAEPVASEPLSEVPDASEPAALEAAETPAPTLFGPDDKKEQHRRKQRVIMSLYDTAPAEPEIVLLDAYTEEPIEESRPRRTDAIPQRDDTSASESVPVHGGAAPFSFAGLQDEPEQAPLDIEVLQEDFEVSAPAGAVLGEVINHDVQTLADTIASPGFGRYGEPIADLRQAIGINDKFLMIRDLFGGDSALFESTIAALNAQPGLDDCMIYIAEHFAWSPDSESAKLIMELLERKFA